MPTFASGWTRKSSRQSRKIRISSDLRKAPPMSAHFRSSIHALAFGAALVAAPLGLCVGVSPAFADLAQDKSVVDAAKAKGIVGEQGDGYLGFVKGSADAGTTAAVTEINA